MRQILSAIGPPKHVRGKLWVLLFLLCVPALSKGASPELKSRFKKLSCAIVQIQTDSGSGTGFFINGAGTIATAAHVLLTVQYGASPQGQIQINLQPRANIRIKTADQPFLPIQITFTQSDADRATADVAVFESGLKSPCFIPIGDAQKAEIGEQMIAMGYPSLSASIVLYQGFLSARHQHLPIPIGHIGSNPVYPTYQILRVQMPITPGASGAPVIDDSDHAIGIISEVPVLWSTDLEQLTRAFANSPNGSGVLLSGFDTTKLLAQLAWIMSEFESPGSGIGVPTSYLNLKPEAQTNQKH